MQVELCNGTGGAPLPDACTWFDGQPYGVSPACCPNGGAPLGCSVDSDCPASGDPCWRPMCNYNVPGGQCMQTWAGRLGDPCGVGGVCRIGGLFRSEGDGLLISEQGWPAVCDVPQWPE